MDKRNRRAVTDTVASSTHSGAPAYGSGGSASSLGSEHSGSKPTGVGGGGGAGQGGAGGASMQGGMGSGGAHGFIHVSDERNPPDWGRVAWPEDIFGSLEVDSQGKFVEGDANEGRGTGSAFPGRYQRSGTYRVVTREGVLGLSEYLRARVKGKVEEVEDALKR